MNQIYHNLKTNPTFENCKGFAGQNKVQKRVFQEKLALRVPWRQVLQRLEPILTAFQNPTKIGG